MVQGTSSYQSSPWRDEELLNILESLSRYVEPPVIARGSLPQEGDPSFKDLGLVFSLGKLPKLLSHLAYLNAYVWPLPRALKQGGVLHARVPTKEGCIALNLHIGGLALHDLVFFARSEMKPRKQSEKPYLLLDAMTGLIATLTKATVVNGKLTVGQCERIAAYCAEPDFDQSIFDSECERLAGTRGSAFLKSLLRHEAGKLPVRGRRLTILALIWRARLSRGRLFKRILGAVPRMALGRGPTLRPIRGSVVVLAGVDGSGKSTLNAKLVEWASLAAVPLATTYGGLFKRNLIPAMKRAVASGESTDAESESADLSNTQKQRRHPLVDFVRKVARDTMIAFDLLLRWFRDVRPTRRSGKTLIMDRGVIDILRLHGGLPILRRLIVALYPKPELVIFLRPKPEDAVARKPDLTLEEAHELDAFYAKHLKLLGAPVVEVSGASPDEVLTSVVDQISQHRLSSAAKT